MIKTETRRDENRTTYKGNINVMLWTNRTRDPKLAGLDDKPIGLTIFTLSTDKELLELALQDKPTIDRFKKEDLLRLAVTNLDTCRSIKEKKFFPNDTEYNEILTQTEENLVAVATQFSK